MGFPACPDSLKVIAHYLKIAEEHDNRDIVISYWCRLHALEVAMQITSTKTPEINKILLALMDWLETTKGDNADNEGITSKICAQATIENYVLKLFRYADEQDRAENWGKNVVKAFYTAGILMDVLTAFGPLSEDIQDKRKYAKWKAAYIHNCLKAGERPVPGPLGGEEDSEFRLVDPAPAPERDDGGFPRPVLGTIERPLSFPDPPGGAGSPGVPSYNTGLPANQWPSAVDPAPPAATPPAAAPPIAMPPTAAPAAGGLGPDQIHKAQKYCKWASSALNYDDVGTAIENLTKALHLLQTGAELE